MTNAINWFELPVNIFDKAKTFYETVLSATMQPMEMGGMKSAFFPADLQNGIGGCITQAEGYEPSSKGSLIYLNGGDDLNVPLSRVQKGGGKIIMPKTAIGQNGFMAHFEDTEGNKVAFHSMK
ncbi:MAG: VOC family protein [Cytophagales bacterium]|nr:VOC family protein [Cytophagales bacterium]